jgi:hypothetical protein
MAILGRVRFSLATGMMLVVTAAAASAFFVKLSKYSENIAPASSISKLDPPILVTLAIGLTAVALGALKGHSAAQMMLQATLAYLGYLSLIWLSEGGWARLVLYWFQIAFALTVALPLLARRLVKSGMPRGPRRTWWKRTFEAMAFAFLNMLLVAVGAMIEYWIAEAAVH